MPPGKAPGGTPAADTPRRRGRTTDMPFAMALVLRAKFSKTCPGLAAASALAEAQALARRSATAAMDDQHESHRANLALPRFARRAHRRK